MKRCLVALAVLLLLAGVAAVFWPADGKSIGHTVTFSDGTTMTLQAVTYGAQHRFRGGGLWQSLLGLLPLKLVERFAPRRGVLTMGRPSVAFWFARRGSGPVNGDPQLILCDASGFGVSGSPSVMRMSSASNWIEGWAYEAWPRRSRTFTVKVYEPDAQYPDATLIGEFIVRNPKPGHYPVWTAPPPPLTARVGDLSVTLFDLTVGVSRGSNKWKPAPNPTVSQTRAGFRIKRNGQPTKEWEIASVEASDATDNVIADLWGRSSEPDAEYAELQPHLWPAEAAWKLRVGFTQRSNFVASEIWTLRGVPLLPADPTNVVSLQTNLQGAVLQYTPQERRRGLGGSHHFHFRITPGRADYRLTLVKAMDDKGREATTAGSFESPREWAFALNVHANSTSVDLTLALHRTRYVEFLVQPRVVSTGRAAPR